MTSFESLGLDSWLARQCLALALHSPTTVQQKCIPAILRGNHVVGGAATGSGKTAAFVLPILQILSKEVYGIFALVMTPSRELAYQIIDQFVAFGAPVGVRTSIVIGGASHAEQMATLQSRSHIVVATPGRLNMILRTFPEVKIAFKNIRFLVLDEADRLIEGDICKDVYEVVSELGEPKPFRQTLLFTATVNDTLTKIEEGVLPKLGVYDKSNLTVCTDDSVIVMSSSSKHNNDSDIHYSASAASEPVHRLPSSLKQAYLFVPEMVKLPYTVCLLHSFSPESSTILFCNSCYRSEILRMTLQLLGFPVCSLNSLLTQQKRLTNLALFKSGITRFLVATDIAARGLDIPEVEQVVHYDFPKMYNSYIHRAGRTARANKVGLSVAIVTENDISLIHKVERNLKNKLPLYEHREVNDNSVLKVLDQVSAAKVEAKLQVEEQFSERAAVLKSIGQSRKAELNRDIREDGRTKQKKRKTSYNSDHNESSFTEKEEYAKKKKRRKFSIKEEKKLMIEHDAIKEKNKIKEGGAKRKTLNKSFNYSV